MGQRVLLTLLTMDHDFLGKASHGRHICLSRSFIEASILDDTILGKFAKGKGKPRIKWKSRGIRLDRTMIRSLPVGLLQPKVRSLHSKVRSLHQISYFAPCCKVKYYLPMIFKVYRWWCVLRQFKYIVYTLSFILATELLMYDVQWWWNKWS